MPRLSDLRRRLPLIVASIILGTFLVPIVLYYASVPTLRVHVKDVDGNLIGGAFVRISGPQVAEGTADHGGSSAFSNVEPGNYTVRVIRGGYDHPPTFAVIKGRELTEVSITLYVSKPISLTVDEWRFNGTAPGPTIRVGVNDAVRLTMLNAGSQPHVFSIPGTNIVSPVVRPGQTVRFTFVTTLPVELRYECSLARQLGERMDGLFVVEGKGR